MQELLSGAFLFKNVICVINGRICLLLSCIFSGGRVVIGGNIFESSENPSHAIIQTSNIWHRFMQMFVPPQQIINTPVLAGSCWIHSDAKWLLFAVAAICYVATVMLSTATMMLPQLNMSIVLHAICTLIEL